MKTIILDFLRGVRTALLYILFLSLIVDGMIAICVLHKLSAWLAIFTFLLGIAFLAVGCVALWMVGAIEKDSVDRGSIVRDIRRRLHNCSEVMGECSVDNPLAETYMVVKEDHIDSILDEFEKGEC